MCAFCEAAYYGAQRFVAASLCRWQLHPDAEASVDALLSTSLCGRPRNSQQQQQQQHVCLNTQWRSWDKHGRMMVQFETVDAAREAVEAVGSLAALCANVSTGRPDSAAVV
jgi:hypothetical protein